jgi:DNA-directed RNA polymerase subunit RPC12/RpoP
MKVNLVSEIEKQGCINCGKKLGAEEINKLISTGKIKCPFCGTKLKLPDYNPFEKNKFIKMPSTCTNCGTALNSNEIVQLKETGRVKCKACSKTIRTM